MSELVVFLRSREVSRTPILLSEVTIGRDASCDVQIDNAGVSRTHAILSYSDGAFRIRDAKSENGITINGRPVHDAELSFGDIVGINKFKLHFAASGGVPAEMLEPPKQAVDGAGKDIVATMTVNADAARAMQEQFIAERRAQRDAVSPAAPNWPWFIGLAAVLGLLGYVAFRLM